MKKVLSLDIGGTNTRAALIDENYKILKIAVRPTVRDNLEAFLENIKATIIEGIGPLSDVIAIAGGVPGQVRSDGYIYALPNVGINDIPLAEYLNKTFNLPVYIINDAEVAALAEANLGIYKDNKSLYFVTISTGVGGALTVDGKLRESSYEVGHTIFDFKGEYIEFERFASGGHLPNLIKKLGGSYTDTKEFFDAVRNKEEIALKIYDEWIHLLASFFNMIQKTYEPDIFTITGGVTKSKDVFFDKLKELAPNSRIELCSFKEEAGLSGGAVLGFQKALN